MDPMPGYKTTVGAIALVLGAIALLGKAWSEDGITLETMTEAWTMIAAALGIWGIAKKIERNGK